MVFKMSEIRVLLLSRYTRLGASSRIRTYQYLPYLESNGFHFDVVPLFDDNYVRNLYASGHRSLASVFSSYLRRLRCLLTSRRLDLLWIEKELFPWLPAWAERLLAQIGIPYVVDYDDAIFHKYDLNSNKLVRLFLGSKIDRIMRHAEVVVVCNDYLGERARKAEAKRIESIPTVVDIESYKVLTKPNGALFTIGWIGSPVTAKYIKLVQPALSEICKNGQAQVFLVGSGPIELLDVPVKILPWTKEGEVTAIQNFDVGIMPLLDEPWERGKCGYKLIQYMACGRPVVASPVGVNQQIVEHGVDGLLANDTADWINALRELRGNVPLREAMGRAGRLKVEKQYCVQVTAPRLAEILRSAAGHI